MLFSGIFTPIAGVFTHYFLFYAFFGTILFAAKRFCANIHFFMSRYDLSKGKNYKK